MSWRLIFTSALEALFLVFLLGSLLSLTSAQVSTSTNYRLESDSINFGGGLANSANFGLESTAGEIATGPSDSASFSLRAGYQQMQAVFLSLTAAPQVVMSPTLGGLSGGTANGSTSVLVLTDSPSGYELTIRAELTPALQKGSDVIADYVPIATPNPDFTFNTGPNDVHFGFSPFGSDVVLRYRNDTGLCSSGSLSTALTCWDGLSTTAVPIASGSSNQPSGATTTLYFRVGIGGGVGVLPGTYVATTTLTALPL